jgi:hypothetical protein
VARIRLSQEESETRQRELESRSSQLATLEDRAARLERDRSALESRCSRLELELAAARRDAAAAAETETAREAMAMLRSQIQHLKLDNARLVRLLSSSKEYKAFVAASFTPSDAGAGGAADGFGDGRLRSSFLAPVPRNGQAEFLGGPAAGTGAGGAAGGAGGAAGGRSGQQHSSSGSRSPVRSSQPPPSASSTALVPVGGGAAPMGWSDVAAYEREYAEELGLLEGGSDDGTGGARRGGKLVPGPGGWSSGAGEPDARGEADLWVPTEVLRASVAFRRKHLLHLPAGVVREFLRKLNLAWRRRLHRQLARLKAKHDKELGEWKRRADQRQPYREVLQASTIHRLHRRLVEEKFGPVLASSSSSSAVLPGRGLADVEAEASALLGLTSEPSAASARSASASYMRPRESSAKGTKARPPPPPPAAASSSSSSPGRSRSAARAKASASASSSGNAGIGGAAEEDGGYGWDPAWTRDFPAAADGGGGHNAARTGWSTAKEHALLLERALETIDALRRELAVVKRRQGGGQGGGAEEGALALAASQASSGARREGHAQGVAWLGRKLVRMADAMGEEVRRRCLALRRAAEGELTASQILALIAALEGEVIAYRSAARAVFEQGLEAGADPETYQSIELEVAGLVANRDRDRDAAADTHAPEHDQHHHHHHDHDHDHWE